jgi:hypothetical protein
MQQAAFDWLDEVSYWRYYMNNDDKKEWQDSHYVCPVCKQPLTAKENGLFCQHDGVEYPVKNGIVDFVLENFTESTNPVLRSVDKLDDLAKIYEGPSWYGMMDKMNAELGLPSIEEADKIADVVRERVVENGGCRYCTFHIEPDRG